jgi:hypothetical protein
MDILLKKTQRWRGEGTKVQCIKYNVGFHPPHQSFVYRIYLSYDSLFSVVFLP